VDPKDAFPQEYRQTPPQAKRTVQAMALLDTPDTIVVITTHT